MNLWNHQEFNHWPFWYLEMYVKYFRDSTLDTYNGDRGFEELHENIRHLKLSEMNGPWHNFTQVDLISEADPGDFSGEHIL